MPISLSFLLLSQMDFLCSQKRTTAPLPPSTQRCCSSNFHLFFIHNAFSPFYWIFLINIQICFLKNSSPTHFSLSLNSKTSQMSLYIQSPAAFYPFPLIHLSGIYPCHSIETALVNFTNNSTLLSIMAVLILI